VRPVGDVGGVEGLEEGGDRSGRFDAVAFDDGADHGFAVDGAEERLAHAYVLEAWVVKVEGDEVPDVLALADDLEVGVARHACEERRVGDGDHVEAASQELRYLGVAV